MLLEEALEGIAVEKVDLEDAEVLHVQSIANRGAALEPRRLLAGPAAVAVALTDRSMMRVT